MTASLSQVQTEYKYSLQDLGSTLEGVNATATTDVRDKATTEAVAWYSRRMPLVKVSLVTNNTTGFYSVPADWTDASRIITVEYPLDQKPPVYLLPYSSGGVLMQQTESATKYFLDPNPSGSFRLKYTTDHTLTSSASTIVTGHAGIVGRMAAAIACQEFSARYANSVSNNLDAVNYRSKTEEFANARKALLDQINTELRRDEYANMFRTDGTGSYKSWKT